MRPIVLLSVVVSLSLASCSTTYVQEDEPYNSSADRRIAGSDYVVATLNNGLKLVMEPPRDYVTAWCGENGCVRKDDLVTIAIRKEKVDVGSAALVPFALPVCLVGLCGPINGTPARSDPVAATPERTSRLWLDRGYVEGSRIYYRSGEVNWCITSSHVFGTQNFETDEQALDYVWVNRDRISGACLSDAGRIFLRKGDQARGRELWAVGEVRKLWDHALCVSGFFSQVSVPQWLDVGPRTGDPAVLDLIRTAAANPSTYYVDRDARSPCQPLTSSSELERRRALIADEASAFVIAEVQY